MLRQVGDTNTVVGILLLVALAVFAGPNALPRLLSDFVPIADEGVPCTWLRTPTNRAHHQSLVGRAASTIPGEPPLSISVDLAPLPSDNITNWMIRITLKNDSIGTIPVAINEFANIVDTGQAGIGLVFNSAAPITLGNAAASPATTIRLLGPRQRCVLRVYIEPARFGQLGINPATTVRAYYRNADRGIINTPGAIYPDQGLWVGVIESRTETVTFSVATAGS
jgi:hypothetical protein